MAEVYLTNLPGRLRLAAAGARAVLLTVLLTVACGCGQAERSADAPPAVEGVQLSPGMWKFTTASLVPGMKAPKERTTTKCIRPDRTDPVEHLSTEQKCEVTERDEQDHTVRWKMTCPTIGHAWQAEGRISSGGTTADGHMDMTMETRTQTLTMELDWRGERLGECPD